MANNMKKILFISGSPRKGNTEFILRKICDSTHGDKELILLRNKDIRRCSGCLYCDKHEQCAIQDDAPKINKKMLEADLIIIGTPNYFDNVPGLLKDFIDRTNPFYETDVLKGKKLITIVTGGGKIRNSKKVGEQALRSFYDAHHMKLVGGYYFKALHFRDIEKSQKANGAINKIIRKINSLK
jgi:multimeric flavodoxin WrbA